MQWIVGCLSWTLLFQGTFCLAGAHISYLNPTSQCCNRLVTALGGRVLLPESKLYNTSVNSYWAAQELENLPKCVVAAQSTQDVSVAVRTLTDNQGADDSTSCSFAIKAGGHGKWSASSDANGIVLDLSAIKTVNVSADKQSVSVGAGAKWGDVYAALDPQNLTVAGARDADVGVGGSSLAGGLGYFTPRAGLTTNTLLDVEMVLACGTIVQTSWQEYQNLNKAIRGGTNNFGVATRFTFKAVPFSGAYGGDVYYALDTANAQLQTIQRFAADPQYDPYAAVTLSFGVSSVGGAAVVNLAYTSPVTSTPAKLQPFTNITSLYNTLRPANMLNISDETAKGSPDGFREATYSLTLENDLPTILAAHSLWNASYPSLTGVHGMSYSFTLEPLPPAALSKTGYDITGLSSSADKPLYIYLLSATWLNATDDELVLSTASKLLNDTKNKATQLGTLHPFLYAGYAGRTQDVYGGIGSGNFAFAKSVSKMVDPKQVFQKQVPGGFKLVDDSA